MGKAKWLTVPLFLLCASLAQGQQCTGQYANDPTYAMLIPKDYAAQGGVTATLTAQAYNSNQSAPLPNSTPSGYLQVAGGGSGTWVLISGAFNNAVSGSMKYQIGSNPWISLGTIEVDLSGSQPERWLYFDSSNIGNIFTVVVSVTGQNGATTQDQIKVYDVDGTGPNLVWQDGLDTNFYYQTITTGGGSSMLTSCQECQAGTTQHCINATHTPYSTISLTNSTSGESQFIQNVQAGNMARSNESLSFSASLAISVRPGDTGTISIDDKIICSADGVIFEQTLPKPKTSPSGGSWNPSVTGELAFTKVALKVPTHCTPLLDPNGNVIGLHCDVAYYCSARSSPPDYKPTGLKTYHYTNPALVPPFWMSMSPGTALVFGRNQPGEIAIWYFPSAELDGVLTGVSGMDPLLLDILSPAWVSDNSTQDCTKWISGIMPWYMPRW